MAPPTTDQAIEEAERLFRAGDASGAEAACRALFDSEPEDYRTLTLLGLIREAQGRIAEALALHDRALRANSGHALAFTRKAVLEFRAAFGPPPAPRPPTGDPRAVSMSTLDSKGRFANQLLQYAFLRFYADTHRLPIETADWIGRDLFDLDDPLVSRDRPSLHERQADLFASLDGATEVLPAPRTGVDLVGYFASHTRRWGPRADAFRALFRPSAKVRPIVEKAIDRLRQRGRTLVGIHLRRGDFGYGKFWIAPTSWYLDWLRPLWTTLDAPVLYVATDDVSALDDFAEFSPLSLLSLDANLPGADFFLDHSVLAHADALAISNSSFSFTAALLNARAKTFVRPHPTERRMVPFEPWRAEVLIDARPEASVISESERRLLGSLLRPTDRVIHLGEFCSDRTHLVRELSPAVSVLEADDRTPVDVLRRKEGFRHVQHLFIDAHSRFDVVLEGARVALSVARIDFIHFPAGPTVTDVALSSLRGHHYAIFRLVGEHVQPVPGALPSPGAYFAVHERLVPLLMQKSLYGLDVPDLCARHHLAVRGVIHVGAHEGQEIRAYDSMGARRILFVEANPAVHARLVANMAGRLHVITLNRAICDHVGRARLNLADFDQSSSLLPLHRHREVYPDIHPAGAIDVEASTLDQTLLDLSLSPAEFDLLTIDVQGAESLVLRGATRTLPHLRAIHLEVNFSELYRGGAQIEDIEDFLVPLGFRRVALLSSHHRTFSDALYVRA